MSSELASLVPWLDPASVTARLHGGCTCETYRVDDTWIAQIGRAAHAARTLRHPLRTLPLW
jgi:hypothetical protein